jgi:hypothetical protein
MRKEREGEGGRGREKWNFLLSFFCVLVSEFDP